MDQEVYKLRSFHTFLQRAYRRNKNAPSAIESRKKVSAGKLD